jgi:signal transduction histidine kinase
VLYCKPQQIQQVFINLLTNARNALNKRHKSYHNNKIININIKKERYKQAKYISILIKDFGIGIPSYNLENIFKPWFTTCLEEGGTGLGLPVSLNIINQHQGFLNVNSKIDEYTQFTVYLPEKPADVEIRSDKPKD